MELKGLILQAYDHAENVGFGDETICELLQEQGFELAYSPKEDSDEQGCILKSEERGVIAVISSNHEYRFAPIQKLDAEISDMYEGYVESCMAVYEP